MPRLRLSHLSILLALILKRLVLRPSAEWDLVIGGLAGVFVFAVPAALILAKYLVMGATLGWLAPARRAATWQRGLWRVGSGMLLLGTGLGVSTWLLP